MTARPPLDLHAVLTDPKVRVVVTCGSGGVGKTTTAAATAALIAARGHKVLLVSTDRAHSLAEALGTPLGSDPIEVEAGLSVLEVDVQQGFQRSWAVLRGYLVELLGRAGIAAVAAEELTVLPGAEEVLTLLAVRDQVSSGRWDAVVVDCAPTAETLRLLALPQALEWYMERVFPTHRRMVRRIGPFLGGVAPPGDRVLDAISALHAELLGVRTLLADGAITSVRMVLTAEAVVLAEARRTLTALSLYGYRLDSVIVNRLIPTDGDDPWRRSWATAQAAQLAEIEASFAGLPIRRAPYRSGEPVGIADLLELGRTVYGQDDPLAPAPVTQLLDVRRAPDGRGERFELSVALPLARRSEVDLARSGDDLVLTVAGHRRVLALPGVLCRCVVDSAQLQDGVLVVIFRPDPALWPAG